MLAILAMLTRRGALRVAPGGCAPPISSVARRAPGVVGTGKQALRSNWKAGFATPPVQ